MPGGDGTGPMGMGPMTGRAAGYCAGYGMPGYANPITGRWAGPYGYGWGVRAPYWGGGFGYGRGFGFGRGRGGGRGWRHRFYATGLPGWARAGWYGPPAYAGPWGYGSYPW